MYSKWFNINAGLRQGCSLSPILFNRFINDLACKLIVSVPDHCLSFYFLCILLYADDIVFLSDSENGRQNMLDILSDWCRNKEIVINNPKGNIMHIRPPSIGRTKHSFHCGGAALKIVEKYNYLGILLNEFLDYNVTAKIVAQSGSRGLGLLIA